MSQSNKTNKEATSPLNTDVTQKSIFTLSYLSNINASYLATTEQELLDNITGVDQAIGISGALLKILGGNWELVWGPFISNSEIQIDGTNYFVTDNAAYMVKYTGDGKDYTGPEYVIAVSGTNPFSMKGWLAEDFLVSETKPWPADFLTINDPDSNASNPLISKGTYVGLETLWNLGSTGDSLLSFIETKLSGKTTDIAVAGHSLGGALSPTLALGLAQSLKGNKDYVNLSFHAFPTAGPTPGNQAFAQVLDDKLKSYNASYNKIDVVPQAWNNLSAVAELLDGCSVPPLFTINGEKNPLVQGFFKCASSQPSINYERLPKSPSSSFLVNTWDNGPVKSVSLLQRTSDATVITGLILSDGSVMDNLTKICGSTPTKDDVKGFADFVIELGLQHTTAYTSADEFGFQIDDATMTVIKSCMNSDKSTKMLGGVYVLEQFAQVTANTCY